MRILSSCFVIVLCLSATSSPMTAQSASPEPAGLAVKTVPERSDWKQTSTLAEVQSFLSQLPAEYASRRLEVFQCGTSGQGRPLVCAKLSKVRTSNTGPALRALIIGDIHGGEVEGKESLQIIAREVMRGDHDDLLDAMDLWFLPVFNPDGNDAISPKNRVNQNGPERGVGLRHNAQSLDLNRDFIKLESPEARSLVRLFHQVDPHLFMDLHTTNGSHHGYHLTYAPSLSPNQDPDLEKFMHEVFMPEVQANTLKRWNFRTNDYGVMPRARRGQKAKLGWYTYSGDSRLAWNYFGVCNRLSVLSEAYSYLDFESREKATRAFVLENLRSLNSHRDQVIKLCSEADARAAAGEGISFPFEIDYRTPKDRKILVGEVVPEKLEGLGTRYRAKDSYREVSMPSSVRFDAGKLRPLPRAWAILKPGARTRETLLLHGVRCLEVISPTKVRAQRFRVEGMQKPRARFQGHRLVKITGQFEDAVVTDLPAGTLIVDSRQPLARVAAQLLEPVSEDGFTTWNFFDDALGKGKTHPVLSCSELPKPLSVIEPLLSGTARTENSGVAPKIRHSKSVRLSVVLPKLAGDKTRYELVSSVASLNTTDLGALEPLLKQARSAGHSLVIVSRHNVSFADIKAVLDYVHGLGFDAPSLEVIPE